MPKLTIDNHEHKYSVSGIPDNTTYCTICGLLKSIIEQNQSIVNTWRENILKNLEYLKDENFGFPQNILNAIDAAYVAGLDDGRKSVIDEIDDYSTMPIEIAVKSNPQAFMDWKKQQLRNKFTL